MRHFMVDTYTPYQLASMLVDTLNCLVNLVETSNYLRDRMGSDESDWIVPPDWLSEQFISSALKKPLRRGSLQLSKYTISPATNKGDNYASQIFRVTATVASKENDDEAMSLVVKILPAGEKAEKMVRDENFFAIESKMLSETLPLLQTLLDQVNLPRLFANVFYYQGPPKEILVMEDLKKQGFENANRVDGLDMQHLSLVVESLASLHAASLKALETNPELKTTYSNTFWCRNNEAKIGTWILGGLDSLIKVSKTWKDIPENLIERLEKLKCTITDDFYDVCEPKNDQFQVLNHGDLWLGNFLFKYNKETPVAIKFVDFQLSHFNSPVNEILYLIFSSSNEEISDNMINYLLECYYNRLSDVCKKLNTSLEISLEDLKATYRRKMMYAFVMSITVFPIVRATRSEASNLDDFVEGDALVAETKLFQSELFERGIKERLPLFYEFGPLN